MLLHGQPDTSATWAALRPRLARALLVRDRAAGLPGGVRLVVPDRPGYGVNPAPATDYPGNAEALRALLDRAGHQHAVLVGHSWAGGVALLTAARYPDRVAGVALLASVGPRCLHARDRPLAWPVAGEIAAYAGLGLTGPLLGRAARRLVEKRVPVAERAHVRMEWAATRYRPAGLPIWRAFLTEQRALVRQLPLLDAALPQVRVPVVVLAGTADHAIPARTPRLLADRLPDAELRTVDGGGHDLHVRHMDQVQQAVLDVVARASAARSSAA